MTGTEADPTRKRLGSQISDPSEYLTELRKHDTNLRRRNLKWNSEL